jgi:hypothetical protein
MKCNRCGDFRTINWTRRLGGKGSKEACYTTWVCREDSANRWHLSQLGEWNKFRKNLGKNHIPLCRRKDQLAVNEVSTRGLGQTGSCRGYLALDEEELLLWSDCILMLVSSVERPLVIQSTWWKKWTNGLFEVLSTLETIQVYSLWNNN